jgi:putative membrane protein
LELYLPEINQPIIPFMKKLVLLFCLLTGLFTLSSCNNEPKKDTEDQAEDVNEAKDKDTRDADFLVKAGSGGLYEVQAAEIALKKATSQKVKDFANMMIKDHTPINEELKTLAQSKNITVPTAPGEDHKDNLDKLNNYTGTEFDQEYMDMMVKDHKDDADLFEDEGEDGKDADIKNFANKHLGTIKMHLDHAKGLEDATDKMDNDKMGTDKDKNGTKKTY